MRSVFTVLQVIFSIGFMSAQTPISGPIEAVTFDPPTGSLRRIIGFLGSASLGPAVWSNLDYASVAPHKNYAIAFQAGRCLVISSLGSDPITTATLPGCFSVPENIAWSGDGSLAVLSSRTGNWVQTISGLPMTPLVGARADLSLQGGVLSAVAVDLRGERLIIAVEGDTAGVFQVEDGKGFLRLLSVSNPIALAFSDDGGKLYVLDRASKQLSELNIADSTSRSWTIPDLDDPIAVRVVGDATQRQIVYVAGGSDRSLVSYDLSSREVKASIQLTFEPTEIEPLGKNSFSLRPRRNNDDPLWTFRNSTQPAVYFVPASPPVIGEDSSR